MTLEDLIEKDIIECNSLDELAFILKNLIAQHSVWKDGSLYSIKALVDCVDGLKIEIYPNEHPPPHFHIKSNGIDASFSIKDCKLLEGKIGGREHKMVKWWYEKSRSKLIIFWNDLRPDDCSVGPILD